MVEICKSIDISKRYNKAFIDNKHTMQCGLHEKVTSSQVLCFMFFLTDNINAMLLILQIIFHSVVKKIVQRLDFLVPVIFDAYGRIH